MTNPVYACGVSGHKSRWPLRIALLCVAVVAGVVAVALLWDQALYADPEPVDCDAFVFHASEWKAATAEDRLADAEALVECGRLEGLGRAEVVELLGPPDYRDLGELVYSLGPDGLGLDEMLLDISFKRGRGDAAIGQG